MVTYVVRCNECAAKVWPPTGPVRGDDEKACYRLALEHVRETGHTDVEVMGGNHWIGDDEPPREFPVGGE